MKKTFFVLGIILISAINLKANACPRPVPVVQKAFNFIATDDVVNLKAYLELHPVSKTALDQSCNTMFKASLVKRSEKVRKFLMAIKFGPNTAAEINEVAKDKTHNLFEFSMMYSPLNVTEELKQMGGERSKVSLDKHETDLMIAVLGNTKEVIEYRIQQENDINSVDTNGNTALSLASYYNPYIDVIKTLVTHGSDINHANKNGMTPFMKAALNNKEDILQVLLNAGANAFAKDKFGQTAIMSAVVFNKNPQSIKLLLSQGLDVNETDDYGFTPLLIATIYNEAWMLQLLISAGADINAVDNNGKSALFLALGRYNPDGSNATETLQKIKVLVDSGISKKILVNGLTAYDWAVMDKLSPDFLNLLKP